MSKLVKPVAIFVACMAVCLALMPFASHAQGWPRGPVRIVVPYPPGGGVDVLGRSLAERLGRLWGVPVLIDNKAGAGTIIGADAVAKSTPDGSTLLFTSDTTITSNPYLFVAVPYNAMTDLVPVTPFTDLPQMVVVHPSVPVHSMKELVDYARQHPGQLNFGQYGTGSQANLLFLGLIGQTGITMTGVPYKGVALSLLATVSGEVQVTLASMAAAQSSLQAGRLRAIAISRAERSPLYPDVPTLTEAGFPDIDPRAWFGLFAPKGTPPDIIARLHHDVVGVLLDSDYDKREVSGRGYTALRATPAEFAAFIADDYAFKGRLIKTAGIRPE